MSLVRLVINNYYTIGHLTAEWKQRARNTAIAQPFTQTRNEIVLPFEPVGDDASRRDGWVAVVSCEPSSNALFFKDSYPRARRNSKDIFNDVEGALVGDILLHPADRQVRIDLRTGVAILLQFFGSRANVMLVGQDGRIHDAFLRTRETIGSAVEDWPRTPPPALTVSSLSDRLGADPEAPLSSALKRAVPSFGTVLIREVLFRAGVEGREPVRSIPPRTLASVAEVSMFVLQAVTSSPRPVIYYRELEPVEFAPAPLAHLAHLRVEEQASVSDGVRKFIGTSRRRSDLTRMVSHLLDALRKEAEHAETTMGRIHAEVPGTLDADRHERYGKLLQVHLSQIVKGQREAIVEDLFSDGREVIAIPLDPHLTPAKNAERYFDKARKTRTAIAEQRSRLIALEERRRTVTPLVDEAEDITTPEELDAFTERHPVILKQLGIRTGGGAHRGKEEARPPFRIFTVEGGFQVWAGKSGENNDLLTTRHTAKNDLWFHVRGAGGSHVVLKVGTGHGEVSKRAKEQAAAVAAYFSKMRKGSLVPVAMCEGKFVRKPRGASTGTVVVERETVLFVNPALPAVTKTSPE
ncbi:MAG: NFACT RNA binding domain-containing protein [Bacteroidota bacterium]